jgi:hypothetical protein
VSFFFPNLPQEEHALFAFFSRPSFLRPLLGLVCVHPPNLFNDSQDAHETTQSFDPAHIEVAAADMLALAVGCDVLLTSSLSTFG